MSEPVHEITLLRHGESQGNAEGRIQGQADFPLTETGQRQAQALALIWQREGRYFDSLICSPLSRTRQTAEPIRVALGLPLELDPDWKEFSFGTLDGSMSDEVEAARPGQDLWHPFFPASPGAESLAGLYARAGRALQSVLNRPAGRYLVVTHGGIMNMALYMILGLGPQARQSGPRFRFDNTTYVSVGYERAFNRWRIYEIVNPGLHASMSAGEIMPAG